MVVVCYSILVITPAIEVKKHIIPHDIEIINIEINLWKRWLICGSYNPQGFKIGHHLDQLGKFLDFNKQI